MHIGVVGLFHLGSVTAACLAQHHDVMAYDPDSQVITDFQNGKPPIFEPGLTELLQQGVDTGRLQFSADKTSLAHADIIWVNFDTPVDDHDQADVAWVVRQIEAILPVLKAGALVIISSQLPAGTTRQLIQRAPANIHFAYSPENLRLGHAIKVFSEPDRVVMGLQYPADHERISALLAPFTSNIEWMNLESAEMTKHALNAFLALSIVFINDVAMLCEQVGADAREVEKGLKSEARIGTKAYLRPGGPIAGGTLLRDVNYLQQMAERAGLPGELFAALIKSNEAHKQWSCRRLAQVLQNLRDKRIATLGLTYKAGTDTLRRSSAVETCEWLNQQGAKVTAYDPVIQQLPTPMAEFIELKPTLEQALQGADAVVITTEWPQFTALTPDLLINSLKQPLVFDASGFLSRNLSQDKRLRYFSVGRVA